MLPDKRRCGYALSISQNRSCCLPILHFLKKCKRLFNKSKVRPAVKCYDENKKGEITMRQNPLKKIVELQKQGKSVGIYSVCSANGYVIEAALKRGMSDGSCVLIESTANQCDQNGG